MGREHKRMPAADRLHVLWRVAAIVEANKWCALDVETTGGVSLQ
ncbi:hypothetical protein [Ktedonobacter racemifer]|nr:hypothetical protein [Ktedonobacter racemifer]